MLPRHPYQSSIHPGRCGAAEWLSAGHQRLCGLPDDHLAHIVEPDEYAAEKARRDAKPQANTYIIRKGDPPFDTYWNRDDQSWRLLREDATIYSAAERQKSILLTVAAGSGLLPPGGVWVLVEPEKPSCPQCGAVGAVRDVVAVREAILAAIKLGEPCTARGCKVPRHEWEFAFNDTDQAQAFAEAVCSRLVQGDQ